MGLAALVHCFASIDGESVALAQLLARKRRDSLTDDDGDDRDDTKSETAPVEAFVPPHAWKDLTGSSAAPPGVSFVVTGAFEPPIDGRGLIQLLVFDTKDGKTRAKVEAPVDGESAGKTLAAAFEEAFAQLGGELGTVRDIDDLSWEALESVLRAERCALHDPLRGGPHDRLAAMVHLGRAIGDAPDGRFPATRLAALALDVAVGGPTDTKLAQAARRALDRAREDAPKNADLVEALAALSLRLGDAEEAESYARDALAIAPGRPRIYALLSEARRSRGDLEGALAAIEDGLLHGANDPLLNTERGIVLAERGNVEPAERAWRMVLDERPLYPPAYTNLAGSLTERKDVVAATGLVDDALRHVAGAHPDVLRRAIQVSLAVEPDGIARAARVATLAKVLVDRAPNDPWARLTLGRALALGGDKAGAVQRLGEVEALAENTSLSAEAQRGRLALEDPQVSLEIDAVLRAAYAAASEDLETIAARARGLAMRSNAWHAWFAVGIAERRRERWRPARDAFLEALKVAPGCTPAHMEIVAAHVALGEADAALEHARRACELEGESARTLAVLATALLAAGKRDEAATAIDRALALDATDEANRALAERIRTRGPRESSLPRLRDIFTRFRRK
ncbi:MAG: tetratricopeptide repeat protein [Labilithrix sp.]|nr:tetratricopeptide repeat protein [Labilithrix sp.]MCW5810722.1 tetratricopeptide repeat protein [Labilithrix sp.]